MRSFEERKNEIFRRSAVIKEKRKKTRNAIAYLCTFCFVSATVSAALYLPSFNSASDQNSMPFETANECEDVLQDISEEMTSPYIAVTNESEKRERLITDLCIINEVIDIISEITVDDSQLNESHNSITPDNNSTPETFAAPEKVSPEYNIEEISVKRITVQAADGQTKEYYFTNNILTDCSTGIKYNIPEEKAVALKQILSE